MNMTKELIFNKTVHNNITGSGENAMLFSLLKFGREEHLSDLLNKGLLYFSSKEEIRKGKKENSDDFRYDELEGATHYESHNKDVEIVTRDLAGEELRIPAERLVVAEKPKIVFGNIISFYGITEKNFEDGKLIPIDEQMKKFGNHFILIYDFPKFFNRLETAMDKIGLTHFLGKVEYFNEADYKGELHFFHKRSSLSYQKEFRFHLDREGIDDFPLEIGSLKDIAAVCHADTLEYLNMNLSHDGKSVFGIRYLKPLTHNI
jgi:hypothetical protein